MGELVYMRETCADAEFYAALELLCRKFGAVVVLTVAAELAAQASVTAQLVKRGLASKFEGSQLHVWSETFD